MLFKSEGPVPTEGELAEHLRRFLTEERPRRQRLWDYYLGEQGVPKGRVVPGRPNNHLTSNYAKYITDVQTGYFMDIGLPVCYNKRIRTRTAFVLILEEARPNVNTRGGIPCWLNRPRRRLSGRISPGKRVLSRYCSCT